MCSLDEEVFVIPEFFSLVHVFLGIGRVRLVCLALYAALPGTLPRAERASRGSRSPRACCFSPRGRRGWGDPDQVRGASSYCPGSLNGVH